MVQELQKFITQDKILFGMRECARQGKKLKKAFASADTRVEVIERIKNMGVEVKQLELQKRELAEKLELGFMCEVFGVTK